MSSRRLYGDHSDILLASSKVISVVQNVSRLLVCGMICIAGMVTGIVEWWNGGMYSIVGRRNETMRLRMRAIMNSGMGGILMASLDLDVCIYNLLYVDAEEKR